MLSWKEWVALIGEPVQTNFGDCGCPVPGTIVAANADGTLTVKVITTPTVAAPRPFVECVPHTGTLNDEGMPAPVDGKVLCWQPELAPAFGALDPKVSEKRTKAEEPIDEPEIPELSSVTEIESQLAATIALLRITPDADTERVMKAVGVSAERAGELLAEAREKIAAEGDEDEPDEVDETDELDTEDEEELQHAE